VFFDLAGTLIEVQGGLGSQYARIGAQFGLEADAKAIDRAFPRAFAAAGPMVFAHARPGGDVAALEKGFWKEVVRGVFAQIGMADTLAAGPTFDRYFEQLFSHFETADAWTVFPDVVPTLRELKGRGLVVGLITNFDHRVFALVEALGLAPLLDSVTIPAIAGAAKPEPGIFEHAAARHGLKTSEAIQVGDSVGDDVEGARGAGMLLGVLLDRKGRYRDVEGAPRISSLAELPPLVPAR
jgi:putative hydrolase of the HAD superfamily